MPTHLKVLRGNPGKQRLPRNEIQPRADGKVPDPPPYLTGPANALWYELGEELLRLRCLTVLDYSMLSTYCTAFQKYNEAEEALDEMRRADPKGRATLLDDGSQNPLVKASYEATGTMRRVAGEFGFTPAARSRISVSPDAKEDFGKFTGLIAS